MLKASIMKSMRLMKRQLGLGAGNSINSRRLKLLLLKLLLLKLLLLKLLLLKLLLRFWRQLPSLFVKPV
jgi:hypothetical protein